MNLQFRNYSRMSHILIIWALAVTLTLKTAPFFFHRTLWLMMMYHQTKFGCQGIHSSETIVERVTFWSYEPSLWPLPRRQETHFSAWHSSSWCSTTMPSLATHCFAVQKIQSGQTFIYILNHRCDLDLEHSHPFFFSKDTLAYDAVLSDKVCLRTV